MQVNLPATIGICSEFMQDESGEKKEVSIVISALKVETVLGGEKLQIVSGCNLWRSCHNGDCWYSLAARQSKKGRS